MIAGIPLEGKGHYSHLVIDALTKESTDEHAHSEMIPA